MRTSVTTIVIGSLAMGASAHAERPRFGPRIGVNLATVEDSAVVGDFSKRIAPTVGAFLLVKVPSNLLPKLSLAFEGGLAYSQKGGADITGRQELRLDYIQLPVTFVGAYQVGPVARFRAFIGPNANVKVHEKDFGGGQLDLDGHATAIDYGILGGAGIELDTDVGVIILDVRYERGLTDVDTGMDTVSHRVLTATAGFAY